MRLPLLALPLTMVLLAACREDSDAVTRGAADACGAADWQGLTGEHRNVLDTASLPDPHRVIGPDDAVTMDFLAGRLNVHHDADDVITRVACG